MVQQVSIDECHEMNQRHDQGDTQHRIADDMDRSTSTVSKHCQKDCRHFDPERLPGIESFDVSTSVERLAHNIGRIPAPKDWNAWSDRPCATSTLKRRCGEWDDILRASDLPVVPNRAPEIIRETRYNNSDFANEVDA